MTNAWTPGPLAVRRINDSARPFAIISQMATGDQLIAGYISNEADAQLYAAAPDMAEALDTIVKSLQGQKSAVAATIITWANSALAKARGAK